VPGQRRASWEASASTFATMSERRPRGDDQLHLGAQPLCRRLGHPVLGPVTRWPIFAHWRFALLDTLRNNRLNLSRTSLGHTEGPAPPRRTPHDPGERAMLAGHSRTGAWGRWTTPSGRALATSRHHSPSSVRVLPPKLLRLQRIRRGRGASGEREGSCSGPLAGRAGRCRERPGRSGPRRAWTFPPGPDVAEAQGGAQAAREVLDLAPSVPLAGPSEAREAFSVAVASYPSATSEIALAPLLAPRRPSPSGPRRVRATRQPLWGPRPDLALCSRGLPRRRPRSSARARSETRFAPWRPLYPRPRRRRALAPPSPREGGPPPSGPRGVRSRPVRPMGGPARTSPHAHHAQLPYSFSLSRARACMRDI